MKKEEWGAFATYVGMVVGAGILGAPYVIAKAGFLTGILALLVVGAVVTLIHLYMGEIVLRTKGKHQLTGYAEKYLGKKGKHLMMAAMIVGIYCALIIYLISISNILNVLFGLNYNVALFLFFIIASTLVFFGLKAIERTESFFAFIPAAFIVLIFAFLSPKISLVNLTDFNSTHFFLPFGVLLFAFLGVPSIPMMNEELKDKKKLKEIILAGGIFVALIYVLFIFSVVGAVGWNGFSTLAPNERMATIALGTSIGKTMFVIANLFAIFAMFNSFLSLGLALKEAFIFDYKIKPMVAWTLTCIIPLGIALLNFTDAISYMGFSGAVIGFLDAVLIVLMLRKAKKIGERTPEYSIKETTLAVSALLIVFGIGLFMQFI